MAMAIIYFLEPLPESSVLVGGSQGLAPLLHVRFGTVYLILIESRWAPNDSSLLRQSERSIPAARRSWADDLWMCKGKHKWFLIGRQVMTGARYYSSWISVVVWSPAKDGKSKLDFGKNRHLWAKAQARVARPLHEESAGNMALCLDAAFTNFSYNENPTAPHSEEAGHFWRKVSPRVSFFDGLWPLLPPGKVLPTLRVIASMCKTPTF